MDGILSPPPVSVKAVEEEEGREAVMKSPASLRVPRGNDPPRVVGCYRIHS